MRRKEWRIPLLLLIYRVVMALWRRGSLPDALLTVKRNIDEGTE